MTHSQQIADLQERIARLEGSKRWKPKYDEEYYFVQAVALVGGYIWRDDGPDNKLYNLGNCFKTREEAEAKAQEVAKVFKGES